MNTRDKYAYFGAAFVRRDEFAAGIPLFKHKLSNSVFSIQVDEGFKIKKFQTINVEHFYVVEEVAVRLEPFGVGDQYSFVPFLIDNGVVRCDILNTHDVAEFKDKI